MISDPSVHLYTDEEETKQQKCGSKEWYWGYYGSYLIKSVF